HRRRGPARSSRRTGGGRRAVSRHRRRGPGAGPTWCFSQGRPRGASQSRRGGGASVGDFFPFVIATKAATVNNLLKTGGPPDDGRPRRPIINDSGPTAQQGKGGA